MPVPTDELTRLSTGAPTGYNNDPFNASTNPYGFADGGYITNFFAALNDLTVVTLWMTEEIAPLVDITAELEALGAIVADLQVLAGIATDIQTLAAIDMQLTTLAAITADITTVAANVADVSAVADDIAKVAAVEAKLADIEAVADGMANIVAVLAMASNISTVVARAADIATLADIEDGTEATNAIQTVAAIATAVSNVSTNSANVAAVAGDLADINTLAGISSSVSALGPIARDIAAVADIGSDVEAAADNIAAIVAAPAAAEAARKSVRHIIFDSGTADAHPGSGHLRLSFDINAATVGQTGFMYHDVTDADLGTITEWIESWDDVINATGRGNLSLVGEADPSISMMLRVTGAVTSGTSYRKIPVTLLQKSVVGGSIADEMEFSETFQANGNDAGGGAGTGDVVSTGSITSGNLVRYADGSGDVIEDSGNAIADFFNTTADTLDDVPDGSTYVRATPAQLTKLSGIETAADVTDAGNVGASIAGSSNKSTPVSADRFALLDSASSNALVYATFAQVLAGFQTSFDSRYSQLAHTHAWASLTSKPTTVSGAGLTDAVTLSGSETLTNKTITTPVLTLEQGASVAPTVEGRIAWDTDDNKLKVGDGAGTKTFSDDGANAATFQTIAGSRERLAAGRTYYVRTDGSDSNSGLANTSGGAFLTVQKAIDVVADTLDLAGYNVTISCGSGTFAAISLRTLVGRGRVTISGNSSAINVASGDNVSASNVLGDWKITGFAFQNTGSGNQILARNATLALGSNTYNYGATGVHITAADGGVITIEDNYTLAGNCATHWQVLNGGTLRCEGITITNTSGLIFTTAFALCASRGAMLVGANTFATTTATAVRFHVSQNGVIRTYGAGGSYLPGNSAGVTATGGEYV